MRFSFIPSIVVSIVVSTASGAQAQTCVVIDQEKDSFAQPDQHAAVTFVQQALTDAGEAMAAAPCPQPYVLYHLNFGGLISVHLQGPRGSRQANARSLEDLPAVYQQMVRSMVTGQAISAANATTDRNSVSASQMTMRRALPDSLLYVRLGYGQLLGGTDEGGTAVGFGYRQEVDELGIDVSVANVIVGQDRGNEEGRTSGSWLRVLGLYFLRHKSNMSPYVGAGFSWAFTKFQEQGAEYAGSGPQGEIAAGLEFLRVSHIRLFAQLDASLPFYEASSSAAINANFNNNAGRSEWVPTFALSLGAAFRP